MEDAALTIIRRPHGLVSRNASPLLAAAPRWFRRSVAITILLALWEIAPRRGLVDTFFLPPASEVFLAMVNLVRTGELFLHASRSMGRSGIGCLLAIGLAIPVGILVAWFPRFEEVVDPICQILRNTSVLAMLPIFILVLGLGEASKIAIVFWGSVWPTLLNTINGVKCVDPLLVKAAGSMNVSGFTLLRKVILPAVLPSILTGVRLSAGVAIVILVAAEMVGAQSGLGFLVFYSEQKYEIANMYAGIVAISLLGVAVNHGLVRCEAHFTRWKPRCA